MFGVGVVDVSQRAGKARAIEPSFTVRHCLERLPAVLPRCCMESWALGRIGPAFRGSEPEVVKYISVSIEEADYELARAHT